MENNLLLLRKMISYFLMILAVHSCVVGFCLIFLPASMLPFFGFDAYPGNFFRAQGGVFHIIMSVIYAIAAINIEKYQILITITIVAKLIATFFLLTYYFAINNIWTILFSGIVDFLMGITLFLMVYKYSKKKLSIKMQ